MTLRSSSARRGARAWLLTAGAVGAALAVTLTGCSSGPSGGSTAAAADGGQTTTLKVAMSWIANTEYGGFWIALDKGYYAAEGLDVEMLPGGPNAPTAESQVAAGTAQLGVTAAMNTAFAALKDNDFKVLGSVFQTNVGCMLKLGPDPVTSVSELQGKRILAQSEETVNELFSLAGVPLGDTQIISTGFDPSGLVNGDGDYYTAYATNQPITLEQSYGMTEGKDFTCTLYGELGMPLYASTIFTTAQQIETNRDALVKFLRATKKGWEDFEKDPHEGADLAVNNYGADLGLDLKQQEASADAFAPLMESDITRKNGILYMDVDLVQSQMYPVLAAAGISGIPAAKDVIDLSLLDDANK